MNNNLLKLFIEGILNIQCHDIKVLNPDLSRDHVEDKDMILDIRVTVASGKQIASRLALRCKILLFLLVNVIVFNSMELKCLHIKKKR